MSQEQQQRAERVWRHFIGMFGGDAVKRKYGDSIPPEWPAVLGKLQFRQLERGMRRLLHSGRDAVPTLPAFVRLCEALGDDPHENAGDVPRLPPPQDPPDWDAWGRRANVLLLKHIATHIGKRGACYGPVVQERGRVGLLAPASEEMRACVRRLIEAKNAWAQDMREVADPNGEVAPDLQRACWEDYIGAAERDIASAKGAQQEAA